MKRLMVLFLWGMIWLFSSCQEQTQNPMMSPESPEVPEASRLVAGPDGTVILTDSGEADTTDVGISQIILLPELPDWPGDFFVMGNATISDDVLSVHVSYTGCRSHGFQLVASTKFRNSIPPTIEAELFHTHVRNVCDIFITEVRKFDLTPLKLFLRQKYGGRVRCMDVPISLRSQGSENQVVIYHVCIMPE
ncbi:MAG: hypothetical protein D6681_02855 [Calditrichaeota bacterium]|nr:MAG: hypothetical protein D6681_02855 [Calditrichota bacterium]